MLGRGLLDLLLELLRWGLRAAVTGHGVDVLGVDASRVDHAIGPDATGQLADRVDRILGVEVDGLGALVASHVEPVVVAIDADHTSRSLLKALSAERGPLPRIHSAIRHAAADDIWAKRVTASA